MIGLPGSGKTTLGRQLADKLGFKFADMDELIEKEVGKSIPHIFNEEGESSFRKYERSILNQLLHKTNQIVSTGGGAPCFFDNINIMNQHGTTVFIDVSPQELVNRLDTANITTRPLLEQSTSSVFDTVKEKRETRIAFYKKAHIIVKNDHLTVEEILEELKKYASGKNESR